MFLCDAIQSFAVGMWWYYQDLLMSLTISLSLPAPLPPLSPSFFLSAAFLLSWNCNRRTKWLANPFLSFLGLCLNTNIVHEKLWYVYTVYIYIHIQQPTMTWKQKQEKSWLVFVCESTISFWNKHWLNISSLKTHCFQEGRNVFDIVLLKQRYNEC